MFKVPTRNPHEFKALLKYFNGNAIRNIVMVVGLHSTGGEAAFPISRLSCQQNLLLGECIYTQQIFNYSDLAWGGDCQNIVQKRCSTYPLGESVSAREMNIKYWELFDTIMFRIFKRNICMQHIEIWWDLSYLSINSKFTGSSPLLREQRRPVSQIENILWLFLIVLSRVFWGVGLKPP
jgi:hypothetical protein